MSAGHWLAIGLVLSGIATQIQGLHSWGEVTSPAFVSGLILNIGGVITSMFTRQLGRDPTQRERQDDASRR